MWVSWCHWSCCQPLVSPVVSACHWIMMGTRKEEVRDIELVVDEWQGMILSRAPTVMITVLQHWHRSVRGRDGISELVSAKVVGWIVMSCRWRMMITISLQPDNCKSCSAHPSTHHPLHQNWVLRTFYLHDIREASFDLTNKHFTRITTSENSQLSNFSTGLCETFLIPDGQGPRWKLEKEIENWVLN